MKYIMLLLIMLVVLIEVWIYAYFYNKNLKKCKFLLRIFIHKKDLSKKEVLQKNDLKSYEVITKHKKLYIKLCIEMDKEKLFTHELTREKLAKKLNTNTTYLSEAIKVNEDGMTVSQFINNYRLKYAAKLLVENKDLCIEAVGECAGFNSRSTYFRKFRECYGVSPYKYRLFYLKKTKS